MDQAITRKYNEVSPTVRIDHGNVSVDLYKKKPYEATGLAHKAPRIYNASFRITYLL